MKTGRVTIAGLIALIAMTGLGMAALRSPSPLVAQITVTFALTCLLIATLAAIVSANRAPAIGFALFGWLYLILVYGPVTSDRVAPWLLTSRMLDEVYVRTIGARGIYHGNQFQTPAEGAWEGESLANSLNWGRREPGFFRYRLIGHSLFAIAHGIFGYLVAIFLTKGRRPKAEAQP